MLDPLGYKKGPDGIRVVPATTGKYAEPAHKMEYQVMVPNSLDFNGDRTFPIVQEGFKNVGVEVTEQSGGDSSAAYAIETDDQCDPKTNTGYSKFDFATVGLGRVRRPGLPALVRDQGPVVLLERHGLDNPAYDKMYQKQATLVNESDRRLSCTRWSKIIHDNWIYTQLVNEQGIAAHSPNWPGYDAQALGYNYDAFTNPHRSRTAGGARTARPDDATRTDYILKRTLFALVTVFVAVTLNFVLFRALPGNAVTGLKCHNCTKQFKTALRHDLGLDKSKWEQYVIYLKGLAHGDLGTTFDLPQARPGRALGSAHEHAAR